MLGAFLIELELGNKAQQDLYCLSPIPVQSCLLALLPWNHLDNPFLFKNN